MKCYGVGAPQGTGKDDKILIVWLFLSFFCRVPSLYPQGIASVPGTEIPQYRTQVIPAAKGDGRREYKSDEEILPTSASFVVFRCNILCYKFCLATLLQKLLQSCLGFSGAGVVSQSPSKSLQFNLFPFEICHYHFSCLSSSISVYSPPGSLTLYFRAAKQHWNSLEGIWAGEMPRVMAIKKK